MNTVQRLVTIIALMSSVTASISARPCRIKAHELKDRIKGGWVGQMIGCAWGGPTEFVHNNVLMSDADMPRWDPAAVNSVFSKLGDDVYAEIPFLEAMKRHGVNCDWNHMGTAFKETSFELWHANFNGRENLRRGLTVPQSGHYTQNRSQHTPAGHSEHDDIDFQIEADFAGIIAGPWWIAVRAPVAMSPAVNPPSPLRLAAGAAWWPVRLGPPPGTAGFGLLRQGVRPEHCPGVRR